ncbi:MAG: LuxR C-terminal-related transcriptional regulator [Clostridiales bacterium]|nr:LuxR C-terminal-related transcriptional regulator [Clostridiales bacterium]
MNEKTLMPVESTPMRATTARREWWGWFGAMAWLFFLMYGYEMFMLSGTPNYGGYTIVPFFFMAVFALSIAVFGLRFGRDPNGLSKVARFTTPVAILTTAVFALLPEMFSTALYVLSPILFAPAMTRRIYGVLHTSERENRLTRYMFGISVCVIAFTVWMIIEPPKEVAFLVPALLAVPAWTGVSRTVPLPSSLPEKGVFQISKKNIVLLAAALTALILLDLSSSVIHTNIVLIGMEEEDILSAVLGMILPAIGFVLYGVISDRGRERTGFICGMSLFIVGIILALMPADAQTAVSLPLVFADGLGGTYTEFFILTIPIFFFIGSKRPVFVASLGVLANLVSSAITWTDVYWVNESFLSLDATLYLAAAISAVIFMLTVFFIFEQHRERTLAAALYALLHNGGISQPATIAETPLEKEAPDVAEAAKVQGMINAGLTGEEIKIAHLMLDGVSHRDIARKMNMKAADFSQHEKAIRKKLNLMGDPDPVIAAVAAEYKLTKREKDMLKCLRDGLSTEKTAAELYISEETVRGHVRHLLRKLGIEKRADVITWLEQREQQ